jgi:hypothetical protein
MARLDGALDEEDNTMPDPAAALQCVKDFWNLFGANDPEAVRATLAPDMVRIGPWEGEDAEIIRGSDDYIEFIKNIKATNPKHGNRINDGVVSPDGRRVYLNVTEFLALNPGSEEINDVNVVLVCDLNDDNLIQKVDIFWKHPKAMDWLRQDSLTEAGIAAR